jgi:hypothetical protein
MVETIASPGVTHPGIGTLEKSHQQEARVLREKAEELARTHWRNAGAPPGGWQQFFDRALAQLRDARQPRDAR